MRREWKRTGTKRVYVWDGRKYYTFRGASRVWADQDKAKEEAAGRKLRRFDCLADAEQWLFAVGFC